MSKPMFQPAPRPNPRTSPEEARQLAEAAEDLGFTRSSTAPEPERSAPEAPAAPEPAPASPNPPLPKRASAQKDPALKFSIPEEVWTELRQRALDERVTVKFLVLRALARDGFAIDLDNLPEDGRRVR